MSKSQLPPKGALKFVDPTKSLSLEFQLFGNLSSPKNSKFNPTSPSRSLSPGFNPTKPKESLVISPKATLDLRDTQELFATTDLRFMKDTMSKISDGSKTRPHLRMPKTQTESFNSSITLRRKSTVLPDKPKNELVKKKPVKKPVRQMAKYTIPQKTAQVISNENIGDKSKTTNASSSNSNKSIENNSHKEASRVLASHEKSSDVTAPLDLFKTSIIDKSLDKTIPSHHFNITDTYDKVLAKTEKNLKDLDIKVKDDNSMNQSTSRLLDASRNSEEEEIRIKIQQDYKFTDPETEQLIESYLSNIKVEDVVMENGRPKISAGVFIQWIFEAYYDLINDHFISDKILFEFKRNLRDMLVVNDYVSEQQLENFTKVIGLKAALTRILNGFLRENEHTTQIKNNQFKEQTAQIYTDLLKLFEQSSMSIRDNYQALINKKLDRLENKIVTTKRNITKVMGIKKRNPTKPPRHQ